MSFDHTSLQKDISQTLRNRSQLEKNKNLLFWYKNLFLRQFAFLGDVKHQVVLEIGSGTSPLKRFYPNILTSDVMPLDYLDYCFDCNEIDRVEDIKNESVDIITLTNVLHHLQDPINFLLRAAVKLKPGGCIVIAEPFFSLLSSMVYKLHHEPSVFNIQSPVLENIEGPLSSANMAIPYMLFFQRDDWLKQLTACYDFRKEEIEYYTGLSYMITGGISRCFPVPSVLFRGIFKVDSWLARRFPKIFASFFIVKLVKKSS